MDTKLNLDELARELQTRLPEWVNQGCGVGQITWQEREPKEWPAKLFIDRSLIRDPWSFGIQLWYCLKEARIVVYDGGWADFEFCSFGESGEFGEPIIEHHEIDRAETFVGLLERMRGLLGF